MLGILVLIFIRLGNIIRLLTQLLLKRRVVQHGTAQLLRLQCLVLAQVLTLWLKTTWLTVGTPSKASANSANTPATARQMVRLSGAVSDLLSS